MWRTPTGDVAAEVLMIQPHIALRDLYNVTVRFFWKIGCSSDDGVRCAVTLRSLLLLIIYHLQA